MVIMRDVFVCQLFLHQCNNRRFLANFVIGDEAGLALNGAMNNHKVRMTVDDFYKGKLKYKYLTKVYHRIWFFKNVQASCITFNKIRMYAPANQSPDFHYNVNVSPQKLTVLVAFCGNSNILGPFFFDGNVSGQSYLNLLNDEVVPLRTVLFQNQFHENRIQHFW